MVPPVVLLCVVVAGVTGEVVKAPQAPTPPDDACVPPVLSTLLQVAGFSERCVTAALAACAYSEETSILTTVLQEVRDTMTQVRETLVEIGQNEERPRHCFDLLKAGDSGKGVRKVYPFPERPHDGRLVVCDHTVDDGGWTVFQRRDNFTVRQDFFRTWVEYELGFGDLEGEFWLGLELLHALTSSSLQELRVDLADFEGNRRWAKYGKFYVGPSSTNYLLSVGRFSGDAGDGLSADRHDGYPFSTRDADHDSYSENCAELYKGGWWYDKCHISNLNGFQYQGQHASYADGINWRPWREYHYSMRSTAMMVRPAF